MKPKTGDCSDGVEIRYPDILLIARVLIARVVRSLKSPVRV
ncbi:MAG TPA: hypothetical protein V6C65_18035 [Allocoleopsis sp.]